MRLSAERVVIPALLGCAVLSLSVLQGPDASWDLRNYHLYIPFALLHKANGTDIAAAQLQSFLSPTADILPYLLRVRLAAHPDVLDAVLGLPGAVGAVLAYFIGLAILPPQPGRWLAVLLAAAYGATGAAGLPTLGTAMSEMPAGLFVLAGLLLLVRRLASLSSSEWVAGALLGVGVGLKLTVAPFAVAAMLAYVIARPGGRLRAALRLGAGALVGAALVGGPWWLTMYWKTGNPIFPYFNNVFYSPLAAPLGMEDERFRPHGLGQALAYPFIWGFQKTRIVSEATLRDPRIALAVLATLVWWAIALRNWWRWRDRPDPAALCLSLFAAIGFALWERQFAIFRYLAPLEAVCGLSILLALPRLLRGTAAAGASMLALALALAAFTRYPDWGRAAPAAQAVSVTVPPLPPNAMVMLLDDAPLSYVAAFADPAVRFIGASNNLVRPGGPTGLDHQVERAIRAHPGPLWSLEMPDSATAGPALAYYGLRRTGPCTQIQSNLDASVIRLCPLQRSGV